MPLILRKPRGAPRKQLPHPIVVVRGQDMTLPMWAGLQLEMSKSIGSPRSIRQCALRFRLLMMDTLGPQSPRQHQRSPMRREFTGRNLLLSIRVG